MACNDEDRGRSRRLGAEDPGRTCQVLGGWAIKRSGDAVCGLHRTHGDEKRRFLD
jgi:hypothetical protein